jgi:hypothetical protein
MTAQEKSALVAVIQRQMDRDLATWLRAVERDAANANLRMACNSDPIQQQPTNEAAR